MASDKFFGTFFPQAGDSLTQIMSRMLGRMVRPSEAEVNLLASAARLGTTATPGIDCRGYRGIAISLNVSAVAGAGTISVRVYSSADFLMPVAQQTLVLTTAGTVSQQIMITPGCTTGIGGTAIAVGMPLSRYLGIDVINSSAVGGNEVTCSLSYYLF